MMVTNQFPRLNLAHTPTPLEHAARLSDMLGCHLFIKRDDCTGLASGGNKARKLEFLMADARLKNADTIVTIGGLQSNHARQTAAASAKLGLDCELILQDVSGTPREDYTSNGNILLDGLFSAKIHRLNENQDCEEFAQQRLQALNNSGRTPYLIPMGGSNVVGSLGYVRCAEELLQQIDEQQLAVDCIVLATGSAGTQAGLLAGLIAAESNIEVLGINVSRHENEQTQLVEALLKQTLLHLGLDPELAIGRVKTNGDYFGASYGASTNEMVRAVKQCAAFEGILLDPVYSGKAMSGLLDLCAKNVIPKGSRVMFLHTGGSAGLFAYKEVF